MSSKKRSSKPIRITLTEEQISDIIQSAAKTRRSLSAQSLEDRIAPSTIGAPMFDPSMGDPSSPPIPYDSNNPPPPMPGGDAGYYPTDPHSIDPNLPQQPWDPLNPPVSQDSMTPPNPIDTTLPTNANPPVTDTPLPPGYQPPHLGGDPGINMDPQLHHQGMFNPNHLPPGPSGDPGITPPNPVEGSTPNDPLQQINQPTPGQQPAPQVDPNAPQMPTPQEFEEHRKNILRQLRGF